MSTLSPVYRNYLFDEVNDADRLQLEHSIYKNHFEQIINRVLADYNLADQLQAQASVNVLDIGCAEGLYLHDVAAILEKRGLLKNSRLSGLDINANQIAVADEFRLISKPPRSYLNFYVQDATQPLENCLGLRDAAAKGFDFIYLCSTLATLTQAEEHLARFYAALKPGGVLYLRDMVLTTGEDGWIPAHPVSGLYAQAGMDYAASLNDGLEVSKLSAKWLIELGATQVAAVPHKVITGGNTKEGMQQLRNIVMIVRNMGPMMIATGRVTAAQQRANLDTLFRELGSHSQGQLTFIDTLARKPLA